MNKNELRATCQYLYMSDDIEAAIRTFEIISDCLYRFAKHTSTLSTSIPSTLDAWTICTMMLNKSLNLRMALTGIDYHAADGGKIEENVDPITIAGLVRSVFETQCVFNTVFRNTTTDDQRTIVYNLWVHAGLAYRQTLAHGNMQPENVEKAAKERVDMMECEALIRGTQLFQSLTPSAKDKIQTRLENKLYLIRFEGNDIKCYGWEEAAQVMGVSKDLVHKHYTYFSLLTHPSNVSVFQFAEMVREKNTHHMGKFLSQFAFIYLSSFIADYITVFPGFKKIFEDLNLVNQIVINFYNKLARGASYSINDAARALD